MANSFPLLKRQFDILTVFIAAPLWIPAMAVTGLAIWLTSGRPIIYSSRRYVLKNTYITVFKFRTMVKDAEKIANRETVKPEPGKLLNIKIQSTLYTPLGKKLEKIHFTELPQLIQVLTGSLTLVGNRPMPENMLCAARVHHPYIEERFLIPSGITGPAQLAGRETLTDIERLRLEITYAYICVNSYSLLLDIKLLFMTLLTPIGFYRNLSYKDMELALLNSIPYPKRELILSSIESLFKNNAE